MSRIEKKFFGAGLSENPCFQATMHKQVTCGLLTWNKSLSTHAANFGIDQIEDVKEITTP